MTVERGRLYVAEVRCGGGGEGSCSDRALFASYQPTAGDMPEIVLAGGRVVATVRRVLSIVPLLRTNPQARDPPAPGGPAGPRRRRAHHALRAGWPPHSPRTQIRGLTAPYCFHTVRRLRGRAPSIRESHGAPIPFQRWRQPPPCAWDLDRTSVQVKVAFTAMLWKAPLHL